MSVPPGRGRNPHNGSCTDSLPSPRPCRAQLGRTVGSKGSWCSHCSVTAMRAGRRGGRSTARCLLRCCLKPWLRSCRSCTSKTGKSTVVVPFPCRLFVIQTLYICLKSSAMMHPWEQKFTKASSMYLDPVVALHTLHLFVISLEMSLKGAF